MEIYQSDKWLAFFCIVVAAAAAASAVICMTMVQKVLRIKCEK